MANEIEEVKQRLDLVDLVGQYVALKKAGANYKATCPFHQEKTASLMVSPEKQIWKCFGCSRGGDHFAFIMEAEHLEFGDALKLLAQKAGVTLQPKTRSEYQTKDRKETLYAINQFSSLVFHKVLLESSSAKTAREYLAKRKISDQMIKTFRLGFASPSVNLKDFLMKRNYTPADIAKAGSPERFRDRIIFPIFDVLGNVVGFTGRALGDIEPKYLNSPETPTYNKGRILYGLNLAKGFIKEHDYVILVEGQMDVISLYQAGIRNVVASSGTAFTESQVTTLSKYTQNFLLAFDNDTAGQTMTRKVIELLLKFDLSSKIIDFGKFKDAGELFENDPKMWREVAKAAKEGLDWWLAGEITTAGNLNFIENKKKVVRAMLPVLKLVAEPTRLDHYIQRLAAAIGVKQESIMASLQKQAGASKTSQPISATEAALTNEEQFLSILIAKPELISKYSERIDSIVYQSEGASRIASELKKLYTNKTLIKNQSGFLSQVKQQVGSPLAESIDSWQFWLSSQWPTFTDELANELIEEKLEQLKTKQYEDSKTQLANNIKTAQTAGDIEKVKAFMEELNSLTKNG